MLEILVRNIWCTLLWSQHQRANTWPVWHSFRILHVTPWEIRPDISSTIDDSYSRQTHCLMGSLLKRKINSSFPAWSSCGYWVVLCSGYCESAEPDRTFNSPVDKNKPAYNLPVRWWVTFALQWLVTKQKVQRWMVLSVAGNVISTGTEPTLLLLPQAIIKGFRSHNKAGRP